MENVSENGLIALFESLADNDVKIESEKGTIKMIQADSNEQIKEFAKESGTTEKAVKQAYKYYKSRCEDGEMDNDDFFTLCAMVDNALGGE